MKTKVRLYKLTYYEIRVAIEALNAKRLKLKSRGEDNGAVSNLLLRFLDVLDT